jgi:hypothetical protein
MHCRGRGLFAAYQLRPPRTVPALKAIAPNAAFRIVIPFANGLHERENVETLLLAQIHFQPARGLSLIQVPARSEVTVVRFVRSYSLGRFSAVFPGLPPGFLCVPDCVAEREGFYTAVPKPPTRLAKSLLLKDRVLAHG